MMAALCSCARPRVFADQPETCHRCGRAPKITRISASTWRLALAIAEVKLGYRRLSGPGSMKIDRDPPLS